MENIAKVISLDEDMEEEAVVQINNIEFVTFIAYAPYSIEVSVIPWRVVFVWMKLM